MRAKYVEVIHKVLELPKLLTCWKSRYQKENGEWKSQHLKNTYDKLLALPDDASAEEIANVIGHKSWTHLSCAGCSDYIISAVGIGEMEKLPYCVACITEAYLIMQAIPDEDIPF